MKVEVTGVFGCIDLPLVFYIEGDHIRGPTSYRVQFRTPSEKNKGEWVISPIRVRSTDEIISRLKERLISESK